jgi:hypothetical protein
MMETVAIGEWGGMVKIEIRLNEVARRILLTSKEWEALKANFPSLVSWTMEPATKSEMPTSSIPVDDSENGHVRSIEPRFGNRAME